MKSNKAFPETLASLMAMQDVGNRELARRTQTRDWGSPTTISFLLRGEMRPSMKAMKAIAKALDVAPETFAEYRLGRARLMLDPDEVGLKKALATLKRCGLDGD